MEKKITLNGQEINIRELGYIEAINELTGKTPQEITKKTIELSTGLTIEKLSKLTLKEGLQLQKVVDQINSIDKNDFQEPTDENKN